MPHTIMYGAYNLCFDRQLGRETPTGPDFFQYIRNGGWPVNRVKVIVFRNSKQEGLAGDRAIPLYDGSRQINGAFMANLRTLVERARQTGFTVQICLFSYHSVAGGETPENVPAALDPAQWPSPCEKLRNFYSLKSPAVVAEQVKLVQAVVNNLRYTGNLGPNVSFELANELRIENCPGPDGKPSLTVSREANCQMLPWMHRMVQTIRDAAGPIATSVSTSTGTHDEALDTNKVGEANEKIVFDTHRPADGCSAQPLVPGYFDLHSGQWAPPRGSFVPIDQDGGADYRAKIPVYIQKMRQRLNYGYGYPSPFIILNDDGLSDGMRTRFLEDHAREAFRAGCGFASKQQYPPDPIGFDEAALDALKRAAAAAGG
ncbi:MAG TPA: hypothetical protein VF746_04945 [Longimicrobium sp.]|jgi:hypothetical protein